MIVVEASVDDDVDGHEAGRRDHRHRLASLSYDLRGWQGCAPLLRPCPVLVFNLLSPSGGTIKKPRFDLFSPSGGTMGRPRTRVKRLSELESPRMMRRTYLGRWSDEE